MTKRKRSKFWTGLITIEGNNPQPKSPFNGKVWQAVLGTPRMKSNVRQHTQEVILYSGSWISAQRALNLIHCCHQLVHGDPEIFQIHPIAYNSQEPKWMDRDEHTALLQKSYQTDNFPVACAVAAKVSRRLQWIYAAIKYKFSMSLYSVHHIDIDPWSSHHLPISPYPIDHVIFSHAIISAYSVVEDLGLEIRASHNNPSRTGGNWNPDVKHNLEQRLTKAGINIKETIPWILRGSKRGIEARRPVPITTKASWASGIVRDSELEIIDAIAYSAWLRSCIASHGVKDLTKVLSPYDVFNVQNLARRLLLESLGFWHWQKK